MKNKIRVKFFRNYDFLKLVKMSKNEACRVINNFDDGLYDTDITIEMYCDRINKKLIPVYSNDDCRSYCSGFKYDGEMI